MVLPLSTRPPRRIAYFLTAHGYGHGVRASTLLHTLPQDVAVDLYTALPESFFREELSRPFRVIPCELDCGCVQVDSVEVDIRATLERYAAIDAQRESLLSGLAERLRDEKGDLVIGDIPPLAFPLARRAGIPSLALCNFSWADIYAPYVEAYPRHRRLLENMRRDYAEAGAHLRLYPFFGDALSAQVEELGMVCRQGLCQRNALAKRFGLDPERKWCLVYTGNYGLHGARWNRLRDFPEWEFLGLYPLADIPNYHHLIKDPTLRYADLTASADLVLGKLGYNLVAECLAHATPILFSGRRDFAEFPVLKALVQEKGLGMEIPMEDLKAMRLGPFLTRALSLRPQPLDIRGPARFLELLGFSGHSQA